MSDFRQSTNLALKIGLYRIALVVNGVFKQMKNHPAFATLFDVSESREDEACQRTFGGWSSAATN